MMTRPTVTRADSYTVAGVLDEPFSQLTPLCGVAVQARQSTQAGTGGPSYVAWRDGYGHRVHIFIEMKQG
jgi:hypothetical protein